MLVSTASRHHRFPAAAAVRGAAVLRVWISAQDSTEPAVRGSGSGTHTEGAVQRFVRCSFPENRRGCAPKSPIRRASCAARRFPGRAAPDSAEAGTHEVPLTVRGCAHRCPWISRGHVHAAPTSTPTQHAFSRASSRARRARAARAARARVRGRRAGDHAALYTQPHHLRVIATFG